MAKKAVATFDAKAGAKHMTKVIRMDKSPKTGAYVFVEQLVRKAKRRISSTRSSPCSPAIEKVASICDFFYIFALLKATVLSMIYNYS